MRLVFPALLYVLVLLPADPAHAASRDPAVIQVQALTSALITAMRKGAAASPAQRYRKLEPVIAQVFALPFMTRISVGPIWNGLSSRQRTALIAAFSRYTISNYAHNFREYSGQSFVLDPDVITRGDDKVIQTRLTSPDAMPVRLLYRMRTIDGTWRIVDVYYNGVSQLTLHRVQFASAIGSGGAAALIDYLNGVSASLMK
jgi:phospholipid transport system substrate-binding protein